MIIKSAENLSKDYNAFSALAHATGEPIYITANGEGDLVLLSIEAFEKIKNTTKAEPKVAMPEKECDTMTVHKLGNVLREMYSSSSRGRQATSIHVFAIYYAKVIEQKRISKKEILRVAGLPESYQTELSKGINIAEYVDVKPEQAKYIQEIEANFI